MTRQTEAVELLTKRCAEIDTHYKLYPTCADQSAAQTASAIRTVLAALPPSGEVTDAAGLVERLRYKAAWTEGFDEPLFTEAATALERLSAELEAAKAKPKTGACSCMEVYGEDPRCIKHGHGTPWAKANPDICELIDRAETSQAALGVARAALRPFAKHQGKDGASVTLKIGTDTWTGTLEASDFRRAAQALAEMEGK